MTHYRFSISWPRILAEGIGRINQAGIDYYNNLINALKAVNIEPMVTLYHWDLPHALQTQGGWLNPEVLDWFDEFARLCFSQFGDRVKLWITINEPWVVAVLNYGHGQGAPALDGPGTNTYLVGHHLILAHARVYRLYHSQFHSTQQGQVGITLNIGWNLPKSDSVVDQEAAERGLQFIGGWFAEPIFGSGDYPEIMKIKVRILLFFICS